MRRILFLIILAGLYSCNTLNSESVLSANDMNFAEGSPIINNYGKSVLERFDAPLGYTRIPVEKNSFSYYLRTLQLRPFGSLAHFYDGRLKPNDNEIYVAVVDLPISSKNIQTSASSVMRLVSEYLYTKKDYNKISFHAENQRLSFVDFAAGNHSKNEFYKYMDFVMERISTPSFCSDLHAVPLQNIEIGDVFVQRNLQKGHAVIVVDMVENKKGEKLFLLAQGFQPAQEIQIISNPSRKDISPWYQLKEGELLTPEWRFMTTDLMRFKILEH